jgi:predicted  nucleic acid-binding Zn-ribbon protein
MSDLVTIDPKQLQELSVLLTAINATMAHVERTLHDGLELQALTAINNLDRKVSEFMSTQESRLQGVQSALTSIAEGINTLQQQVTDLKANNPALEDEISGIEGTVKAIADDINGVVPDSGGGEPVIEEPA